MSVAGGVPFYLWVCVSWDLQPGADSQVPSGGNFSSSKCGSRAHKVWALLVAAIQSVHRWKNKHKDVDVTLLVSASAEVSKLEIVITRKQGPTGTQAGT